MAYSGASSLCVQLIVNAACVDILLYMWMVSLEEAKSFIISWCV